MIGQTFYLAGSNMGWFKSLLERGQLPPSGCSAVPGAETVEEAVKRFPAVLSPDFIYKIEVIPLPSKPVKSTRKQAYEVVAKMISDPDLGMGRDYGLYVRFSDRGDIEQPVRRMLIDVADRLFGKYNWDGYKEEAAIQKLKIMKRELR